jgi:phosphatidylcholine synthase
MSGTNNFSYFRYILAWQYTYSTALGLVFGFLAIIAISRHEWLLAFVWMAVTVFIDSIDGILARAFKVQEVLPNFDGALLDNIVDYFTYVIVPASFLYETHSVPYKLNLLSAILITLSSAYQFCQSEAKTDNHC